MTKKPGALASALRKSGATVGGVRDDEPATVSQSVPLPPAREPQGGQNAAFIRAAIKSRAESARVLLEARHTRKPATQGKPQASREGTAPITVHLPKIVRRQLKTLAAEEERKVEDMVSEALNLLFVKYRKAEIAPRKS